MSGLGEFLNTVQSANPCPTCHHSGGMQVFEHGVRWTCGHTRPLPPIGQGDNYHTRNQKGGKT